MFTASYGGFVNGDTTSVLSGAPGLTTSATVTSPVGIYLITATNGTLAATNYSFSFVNGTLTVSNAALTVTASNQSKIYGQTLAFAGTEFTTGRVAERRHGEQCEFEQRRFAGHGTGHGFALRDTATNAVGARLTNYSYQLCEWHVDGRQGDVGGDGEQHEPDLWRGEPGVHGELQWLCERRHDERVEWRAGFDDECDGDESGGKLHRSQHHRDLERDELQLQLCNGTLVVGNAALTVTANNTNRIYGAANPAFTARNYSGFVNGDTASSVELEQRRLTTAATAAGPVGITRSRRRMGR